MSRTLFFYIFKDLFKIFVMASAALAGIMSFGGLLRPLTREGLDAAQVTKMLGYFVPAMTTYSFPVAALFATAVVYGRLAADNELTACKAGGISLLSLTVSGPALVLGLIVAITSLLFLCLIVPACTLRVEKVIYSNLAKLVQSRIERNHQIEFEDTTIFAQEAHVRSAISASDDEARQGHPPRPIVGYKGRRRQGPPQNEVQRLTFNNVTGGKYTVAFHGKPGLAANLSTANIPFIIDDTKGLTNAMALQNALNAALADVGGETTGVTPVSDTVFDVTFRNRLGSSAINLLTVDTSNLTTTTQLVEMIAVEVISIEKEQPEKGKEVDKEKPALLIPKEFYTASRAYVYIKPMADGQKINVDVILEDGFKFPHKSEGATHAGIKTAQYGPFAIPSPIKEDVKFMSVGELHELYADLSKSRKLQGIIADFVKNGQRNVFLNDFNADLTGPRREARFALGKETYTLHLDDRAGASRQGSDLSAYVTDPPAHPSTQPSAMLADRPIVFMDEREGREPLIVRAASVLIRAQPMTDVEKVHVTYKLQDCLQMARPNDPEAYPRGSYELSFDVSMSEAAKAMAGQTVGYYDAHAKSMGTIPDQFRYTHDKTALVNNIIAESNGRASFAISCLILVMVGCALGMMFRSGNFLTAFAVSFIPALLSITLIVAGQRMAGNVPWPRLDGSFSNPLKPGLVLIWSGNGVNLLLAIGLLWKLGRR